jgi:hypothetical protein
MKPGMEKIFGSSSCSEATKSFQEVVKAVIGNCAKAIKQ